MHGWDIMKSIDKFSPENSFPKMNHGYNTVFVNSFKESNEQDSQFAMSKYTTKSNNKGFITLKP